MMFHNFKKDRTLKTVVLLLFLLSCFCCCYYCRVFELTKSKFSCEPAQYKGSLLKFHFLYAAPCRRHAAYIVEVGNVVLHVCKALQTDCSTLWLLLNVQHATSRDFYVKSIL